jgi:hypothetical protein
MHIEKYRGTYYFSNYFFDDGYMKAGIETKTISITITLEGKIQKQLSVFAKNYTMSKMYSYRQKFKNQYIVGLLLNTYLDNLCQSQKIEKDIRKQLQKERKALLRLKKLSTK